MNYFPTDVYGMSVSLAWGNPMDPKPSDLIAVKGYLPGERAVPSGWREVEVRTLQSLVATVATRAEIEEWEIW